MRNSIIGGLTADGPLKSVDARTTDVQGRVDIAGGLAGLALGDCADSEIFLHTGGALANATLQAALTFGRLSECRLVGGDVPIKSLSAVEWLDDDGTADVLTARWLGTLTITGRKGLAPLDGDFEADLALTATNAKGVSLGTFKAAGAIGGSAWALAGSAGAIKAGSTDADWSAQFGGPAGLAGVTSITTTLGQLSGTITAWSIGSVTAKTDLKSATLDLKRPLDARLLALGKLTAGRWIDAATITSDAKIGTITAGGMKNSVIFAGVNTVRNVEGAMDGDGSVMDLPLAADLSADTLASIKALTISGIKADSGKGYKDSFINSNIAAASLGTISLAYAHLDADGVIDNGGVPFGLTGKTLTKLTYKDAIHKYTWKAGQALPPWPDINDLKLRLG